MGGDDLLDLPYFPSPHFTYSREGRKKKGGKKKRKRESIVAIIRS